VNSHSSKFKILTSLEPSSPIQKKRICYQKSQDIHLNLDELHEDSLKREEMILRIKELEERIKMTKHNVVHERQMNEMLKEENENLRTTNKMLSKQGMNTTSSSLPTDARVTENLYENLMINDLKTELGRTNGQINLLQDRRKFTHDDIGDIKKQNKQLISTIERYKRILDDHTTQQSHNKEKEVKVDEINLKR
jgi:hypothetical protein